MRLVLASESPRRKMLLESAGIAPLVVPSNVDEDAPVDDMDPGELVKALARRKIRKVAERMPDDYVLGGDTIVYIDGKVLGKPESKEQARDMLRRICGRTHVVYTGVALYEPLGRTVLDDFDATRVTIRSMDEEEIRWYVNTEEPMDKAGSYALQGAGAFFVERVEGDFSGVIGLPLPKVYSLLRRAGVPLRDLQNK